MAHVVDPQLLELLRGMTPAEASDLHLVPGNCPMYRTHGHLRRTSAQPASAERVLAMVHSITDDKNLSLVDSTADLDFAVQVQDGGVAHRFRVNVFSARGERGACFRAIPTSIPTLDELGFPQALADRVTALSSGLVLVTGATGSGKTTSLAAMLQLLNARGNCRIITIEQPIEYVYPQCEASIVTQREVGVDVPSFHEGLRSGLRQDPDVLLVGEIRDRETAQLALSAAETGHVIFGTLHSADAKGAISRLVDLFPAEQHDDIRGQLSMSLRFVMAQHLLAGVAEGRRVLAMEVLLANFAVASSIRQGKLEALDTAIQSGRKDGMWTLDADLRRLVDLKRITLETAREHAKDATEFLK
ncbi:MAG: PilT/PilU family type 4a pilus ATPase [Planctomycetota bacterium]